MLPFSDIPLLKEYYKHWVDSKKVRFLMGVQDF